jgi:hypothetical protein
MQEGSEYQLSFIQSILPNDLQRNSENHKMLRWITKSTGNVPSLATPHLRSVQVTGPANKLNKETQYERT